jgi:DNA repair protein RecO (recombination protein O)
VLHHYDWSESSLILEVFTRHQGRIALVAKGAKRPSSNFRPVLLPLQPLQLDFGGDAEIRTLKGAEWMGGHVMPTGEALLSGYYLNELLLRLLARDDPHRAPVRRLCRRGAGAGRDHAGRSARSAALRAFELLLLRESACCRRSTRRRSRWRRWRRRRYAWCPRPACAQADDEPRCRRRMAGAAARAGRPRAFPPRCASRLRRRNGACATTARCCSTTIAASPRCARGR